MMLGMSLLKEALNDGNGGVSSMRLMCLPLAYALIGTVCLCTLYIVFRTSRLPECSSGFAELVGGLGLCIFGGKALQTFGEK